MVDDPDPDLISEFKCNYCSRHCKKEEGNSYWEGGLQYVILKCDCGKKNWARVYFTGIDPSEYYEKEPVIVPTRNKQAFEKEIPVGKMAEAHELAPLALWLLSPLSRYVTGQTITHDGGMVKGIFG